MSGDRKSPATVEESAEIAALREQAAQTRREAAQTLTALADKVAARDPRTLARRALTSRAITTRRAALGKAARSRPAVIGGPLVLAMGVALIVYRRYYRSYS